MLLAEAFVEIRSRGMPQLMADYNRASGGLRDLASYSGQVGDKLGGLPGLAARAFGPLGGAATEVALSIGGITAAAGVASAALVAGLGVAGTLAASRLETSLADVATISVDVRNNMDATTRAIRNMSVAANADPNLLSRGLYQTISAGITDLNDALEFTAVAARAARAGLSDTFTAVDGLTSAVNAYGLEASQVNDVSDTFFKTVERGKLTFDDIASGIGSVAPLASQLGVSLEELLATSAALTLTGQSLSEAFTGIRAILVTATDVGQEGKAAGEAARALGVDFSSAALQAEGLTGVLDNLREATGGNVDALGSLFGRVEALNAAVALTGRQSAVAADILEDLTNKAGATDQAFQIQQQTLSAQAELLGRRFKAVLLDIGDVTLPLVRSAVMGLNRALESTSERHQRIISQTTNVISTYRSESAEITNLVRQYHSLQARLSQAVQGSEEERSVRLELTSVIEDLITLVPELALTYDGESTSLDGLNRALQLNLERRNAIARSNYLDGLKEQQRAAEEQAVSIRNLSQAIQGLQQLGQGIAAGNLEFSPMGGLASFFQQGQAPTTVHEMFARMGMSAAAADDAMQALNLALEEGVTGAGALGTAVNTLTSDLALSRAGMESMLAELMRILQFTPEAAEAFEALASIQVSGSVASVRQLEREGQKLYDTLAKVGISGEFLQRMLRVRVGQLRADVDDVDPALTENAFDADAWRSDVQQALEDALTASPIEIRSIPIRLDEDFSKFSTEVLNRAAAAMQRASALSGDAFAEAMQEAILGRTPADFRELEGLSPDADTRPPQLRTITPPTHAVTAANAPIDTGAEGLKSQIDAIIQSYQDWGAEAENVGATNQQQVDFLQRAFSDLGITEEQLRIRSVDAWRVWRSSVGSIEDGAVRDSIEASKRVEDARMRALNTLEMAEAQNAAARLQAENRSLDARLLTFDVEARQARQAFAEQTKDFSDAQDLMTRFTEEQTDARQRVIVDALSPRNPEIAEMLETMGTPAKFAEGLDEAGESASKLKIPETWVNDIQQTVSSLDQIVVTLENIGVISQQTSAILGQTLNVAAAAGTGNYLGAALGAVNLISSFFDLYKESLSAEEAARVAELEGRKTAVLRGLAEFSNLQSVSGIYQIARNARDFQLKVFGMTQEEFLKDIRSDDPSADALTAQAEYLATLQDFHDRVITAMLSLRNDIENSLSGVLANALLEGFDESLGETLRRAIQTQVLNQIVNAFVTSDTFKNQLNRITEEAFGLIENVQAGGLDTQNQRALDEQVAYIRGLSGKLARDMAGQFDLLVSILEPLIPQLEQTASDVEQSTGQAERQRTGGFTIAQITGPTRDILVDMLRPLGALSTTFPSMLDVMREIRDILSDAVYAPGLAPIGGIDLMRQAELATAATRDGTVRDHPRTQAGLGADAIQETGLHIETLNVQVQQITDLTPEEINRQLGSQMRLGRRTRGTQGRKNTL